MSVFGYETDTSDDQRMGRMQLLAANTKADDQGEAKCAVIFLSCLG